jgi:hypothetical protein
MFNSTGGRRQKRSGAFLIAFAVLLGWGCGASPEATENIAVETGAATAKIDLLQRWAPVHYQDVNRSGSHGISGRADFILRFDYEPGSNSIDWFNSWDKWDNLGGTGNDLSSWMYAEIIESPSHWFLYYMMYHPRDWAAGQGSNEHENDAEGVLLAIRKDWSQFGSLEAMVTLAHGGVRAYSPNPAAVWPRDNVAREIQWELSNGFWRAATYAEAEGHGVYGCSDISTKCNKSNEDGIRYLPGASAQVPGPIGIWTEVSYDLRKMDELWQRRNDSLTFNQTSGAFNGNQSGGCGSAWFSTCSSNAADPPWKGRTANDPAAEINALFEFRTVPPADGRYLRNPFKFCEDITTTKPTPLNASQSCIPDCTQAIAAQDPYCVSTAWDAICLGEVETICGIQTSDQRW